MHGKSVRPEVADSRAMLKSLKVGSVAALLVTGLMLAGAPADAAKLKLPQGMGGVPDIGAIPCEVFSKMIVPGPKGTRLSLLTWAAGNFAASSGKSLQELVDAAELAGESWDFDRLTGHMVGYCAANPTALTRDAVADLGQRLINPGR